MLAENTAADANAHSEGINKGIIYQGGDCKKRAADLIKRPDKMPVEEEIAAKKEQNRQHKEPSLQQDTCKYQEDVYKTCKHIKFKFP